MEPTRQEVEGGVALATAPRPRKPSKGRQRIEIRYIEDKAQRQVTFSKRRMGIFKKAGELSQLCGACVAVVVFSERGRPFAIGAPSVDVVLRACDPLPGEEGAHRALYDDEEEDAAVCRGLVEAALRQAKETEARVKAEKARMNAIGEKVMQAKGGRLFWWDADVEQLGEAELPEFARALQRLRDNVQRRADHLSSADPPPPTPLPLQ
ncbi:hypothetical protein PR202_gb22944 [Eleusine coracana subsp. coracana]|uniref:MADS-box domain-containing protein n=1 Tax=Eleusine coracana subsp. coracana TaxID=191504 RepID=A0AAV5FH38_ELECO|nr:hypothetical protein QOZ80_6BG0484660 [Eleusine coracana subsp. coracana]GJN34295.1 hypothetical protein PR202_gb22944 [Eleusine coracana subsp. coracana]